MESLGENRPNYRLRDRKVSNRFAAGFRSGGEMSSLHQSKVNLAPLTGPPPPTPPLSISPAPVGGHWDGGRVGMLGLVDGDRCPSEW